MSSAPPRVRFAPSPTGFLHVGGARTALFNWLFARKHGGVFVLRIEDTNRARSSEEMVRAILDGMRWMGLKWDEGPFFQGASCEMHMDKARELLSAGKAYKCWCAPEELKARRVSAGEEGEKNKVWKYDRTCLNLDAREKEEREGSDRPFCIRLEVPEGKTSFEDMVHGEVGVENAEMDDLVLVRSDGSPTYNLACAADDAAMKISHVIRGDDHISNTPKQILIYKALGIEPPRFGHLPLIFGENKRKLSKRHGAISVTEYRENGYLPEALFNFLALLGWSPGEDKELFSRDEAVELFGFDRVSSSNAVFGHDKLDWMNGQYMARQSAASLVDRVRVRMKSLGRWDPSLTGSRKAWFLRLLDLLKSRSRTVVQLAEATHPYLVDEVAYEAKAVKKHFRGEGLSQRLLSLADRLEKVEPFTEDGAETALRNLAEVLEISAGKLIHPSRVSLVGRAESPGIFEVMVLLGRERTVRRLRAAAGYITERAAEIGTETEDAQKSSELKP